MFSIGMIKEIQRLSFEEGLSQRRIAKLLGVSRGTVATVTRRHRLDPHSIGPSLDSADCRPQRCPGCGGRVYLPCRLCIARAYDARRRAVDMAGRTDRAPNGHPSSAVRSTERGELFALEFLDSPNEEGDLMRLIADSAAQDLGAHPPCL